MGHALGATVALLKRSLRNIMLNVAYVDAIAGRETQPAGSRLSLVVQWVDPSTTSLDRLFRKGKTRPTEAGDVSSQDLFNSGLGLRSVGADLLIVILCQAST